MFTKPQDNTLNLLFLLFIVTPLLEIGVFIQVGDQIGLLPTLAMIFITAVIGVNLLKNQGLSVWQDTQTKLASGQIPALEMASAAQLLFAGGLLLTPGFVTDTIGFLLLIPNIRKLVAQYLIKRWQVKAHTASSSHYYHAHKDDHKNANHTKNSGRVIEGEYTQSSKKDD